MALFEREELEMLELMDRAVSAGDPAAELAALEGLEAISNARKSMPQMPSAGDVALHAMPLANPEVAATLTTAAIAEPVAGIAGILSGGDAGAVEAVREGMTYQPRTEYGQRGLQVAGAALAPVASVAQGLAEGIGEGAVETGRIFGVDPASKAGAALYAAGSVVPTAVAEYTGAKLAQRIAPDGAVIPAAQRAARQVAESAEGRAAENMLIDAAPSVDDLRSQAGRIYREIDELGGTVPESSTRALAAGVVDMLRREGYNPKIHPKLSGVIDEANAIAEGTATLEQIETFRRVAGAAARSTEPDEARLASMVIDRVDDFIDSADISVPAGTNVGAMYREARGLWQRARKAEVIQEAVRKAGLQATGLENGIRTQFRSILNNKRRLRGFTDDEIKAMQRVVQGDTAANLLKLMGRFGFSEGQATNIVGGAIGGVLGGQAFGVPGAVAVPILAQGARSAAQKITSRNAALAESLVRAGNNGRQIALEYVRNVPAKARDPQELAGLLIEARANPQDVARISDPLVRDSALIAALILGAEPPVEEGQQQ